jgi:regulation of enolase protein 1 (concanavalin A-like superfamily)
MKCGTEFFDGQRHASVVFTRNFSDWSTMPDLSNTGPIWWRAVREKDSIEVLCSVDGKNINSVRQAYFLPEAKVEVGVMCAAPSGIGFEATFDGLTLETTQMVARTFDPVPGGCLDWRGPAPARLADPARSPAAPSHSKQET